MKKFVLTSNGKEVKMGDKLVLDKMINTPMGEAIINHEIIVDDETISALLKIGVIKPVEDTATSVPMNLSYYAEKIAERMGWKTQKVYNYINSIGSIYPAAAFSILLREVAVELDKKYNDHIENSPEIYSVSMTNGIITQVNKAHIKNYRNFAAFRNIEDARIACKITREILKYMFKHEKEK